MVNASGGTTVRVSKKTHKKLEEIRKKWLDRIGPTARLSMGAMIDFMCDEELEHLQD